MSCWWSTGELISCFLFFFFLGGKGSYKRVDEQKKTKQKTNGMFDSSGHPGSTWPMLCFHQACRKGESALLFLPGPGFCWVQATTWSRWFMQVCHPVALGWQTEGCLSNVLTCTLVIYTEVNFYLSLINACSLQASHHRPSSLFESWIFDFGFLLFFSSDFTTLLLACLWEFLSATCTETNHAKIREMLHHKWGANGDRAESFLDRWAYTWN